MLAPSAMNHLLIEGTALSNAAIQPDVVRSYQTPDNLVKSMYAMETEQNNSRRTIYSMVLVSTIKCLALARSVSLHEKKDIPVPGAFLHVCLHLAAISWAIRQHLMNKDLQRHLRRHQD